MRTPRGSPGSCSPFRGRPHPPLRSRHRNSRPCHRGVMSRPVFQPRRPAPGDEHNAALLPCSRHSPPAGAALLLCSQRIFLPFLPTQPFSSAPGGSFLPCSRPILSPDPALLPGSQRVAAHLAGAISVPSWSTGGRRCLCCRRYSRAAGSLARPVQPALRGPGLGEALLAAAALLQWSIPAWGDPSPGWCRRDARREQPGAAQSLSRCLLCPFPGWSHRSQGSPAQHQDAEKPPAQSKELLGAEAGAGPGCVAGARGAGSGAAHPCPLCCGRSGGCCRCPSC